MVQVAPIKPTLKAPVAEPVNQKVTNCFQKFAFSFNLRRYSVVNLAARLMGAAAKHRTGIFIDTATKEVAAAGQGLTLVHFSAQPQLNLSSTSAVSDTKYTLNAPLYPMTRAEPPRNNPLMPTLYHKQRLR